MTQKYFPKIVGEKVYLSPLNPEDYEIYTKWMNDKRVVESTLFMEAKVVSLTSEKKRIEEMSKSDSYSFSIVKKDDDQLIWTIELCIEHQIHRLGNVGIAIGEVEERGKGYWPDAITALLDYGFNALNLNNIKLDVLDFNEKAIKCYKKCGFKEIWHRRHAHRHQGKRHDLIYMDITRDDFKK